MRTIRQSQRLKIPLDKAWEFLSNPRNLSTITPPELGFEITSEVPEKIYPGLLISYKVRPLFGVPMTWVSEIKHMKEPYYFVDEQIKGPYKFWHHQHWLKEIPGGVEMSDEVNYIMPFGPLGSVIHPLIVKSQLEKIFGYRRAVLAQRFGEI